MRRRVVVYGKSKGEALDKLRAINPVAAAAAYDAQRTRLRDHLTNWLEFKKPSIAPKSHVSYKGTIKLHISPYIGDVMLAALSSAHLQSLQAQLARKNVSPRTRQLVHVVLKAALKTAVRWRVIAYNPADAMDAPQVRSKPPTTWSAAEVGKFLKAARADRYYALFVLALASGMRQGELIGLRRERLDLERGFVSVTGQADDRPTKRSSSVRRVDLPKSAVRILRAHVGKMAGEKHRSTLVFPTAIGTTVGPSNLVRRHFDEIIEAAKVKRIRFHDLRHTFATLMLERGVHPKIVQEMLGHASITQTLGTYSHVNPTMQKAAARKLEKLF